MPDGPAANYFNDDEEEETTNISAVNTDFLADSSHGRKRKALIASDSDDEVANQSAPVPRLSSPPPPKVLKPSPFSPRLAKHGHLKVSSIKPNTSFTVVETPAVIPTGLQSKSAEAVVLETTISPRPQAAAIDICPTAAQVATSSDIIPTATPSPVPTFTTVVDAPSADKGKQKQGSPVAAGPTAGSNTERTVSEEVAILDRVEDQKNMTRLIQLVSESSDLVLKVVKNSNAKDTLLERIAPLAEKAKQAQEELAILRNEVAGYRDIRSNFKDKLRAFLGHDPAIFEAKKQAEEQLQKLQAELTLLQSKNQELAKEKDLAEKKLAHDVALSVKSDEKAKKYKDKLKTLMDKHEELRTSNAKEISSMKMKLNNDLYKMKAELDEARRTSAELCEDAEPILDTLYTATAGSNASSF
uniref:Uncharacterized protein n=1 Tax=Leersia perrieri TaxID=77586 RepID=A0A0D9X603_9ORYZ